MQFSRHVRTLIASSSPSSDETLFTALSELKLLAGRDPVAFRGNDTPADVEVATCKLLELSLTAETSLRIVSSVAELLCNICVGLRIGMDTKEQALWIQALWSACVGPEGHDKGGNEGGLVRLLQGLLSHGGWPGAPGFIDDAAGTTKADLSGWSFFAWPERPDPVHLLRAQAASVALLFNLLKLAGDIDASVSQPAGLQGKYFSALMACSPLLPLCLAAWAVSDEPESEKSRGKEWGALLLSLMNVTASLNQEKSPFAAVVGGSDFLRSLDDHEAARCITPFVRFVLYDLGTIKSQLPSDEERKADSRDPQEDGVRNACSLLSNIASGALGLITLLERCVFTTDTVGKVHIQEGTCSILDLLADSAELSSLPMIEHDSFVDEMIGAGVVAILIDLLHALNNLDEDPNCDDRQAFREIWTELNNGKQRVLRCIASLAFHHTRFQDEVRGHHLKLSDDITGIHVLLSSSRAPIGDDSLKFVREWAILAIRNICEGNTENQAVIDSLQVNKVIQDDTLAEQGIEVVHDEANNKFRLRAMPGATANVARGEETKVASMDSNDFSDEVPSGQFAIYLTPDLEARRTLERIFPDNMYFKQWGGVHATVGGFVDNPFETASFIFETLPSGEVRDFPNQFKLHTSKKLWIVKFKSSLLDDARALLLDSPWNNVKRDWHVTLGESRFVQAAGGELAAAKAIRCLEECKWEWRLVCRSWDDHVTWHTMRKLP